MTKSQQILASFIAAGDTPEYSDERAEEVAWAMVNAIELKRIHKLAALQLMETYAKDKATFARDYNEIKDFLDDGSYKR